MRVVALISGGKDSTFNMMQCIAAGHEITALANISPHTNTELDSYMYQCVGFEAVELIAEAMSLPLFRCATLGKSCQHGKTYEPTENDEVEDLYNLLKSVKDSLQIDAVSVGAILSDYQRVRVENVCVRLGLVSLAYLWQRNQEELLQEMIKCEVDAIIIKVAALGLEPSRHLGRSLRLLEPHLEAMHEKYGLNVCGEGGEYETLTLDCPLYKSRIIIDESEVIMHSDDAIAPVGYLKLNKMHLETKLPPLDLNSRMSNLPLKKSEDYIICEGEEATEDEEADSTSNEDDYSQMTNSHSEESFKILERSEVGGLKANVNYGNSRSGWMWVGSIQGDSSDPHQATKEAMVKLKYALEANNQTLEDVCSINMFVSDMSQYLKMNAIYCETFHQCNPPTRACVQVPLPKHCPVILEAISWSAPSSATGDNFIDRQTMHVQSISHWAPANIGPYSQAIRIGDIIHLAGQISLIPGSMTLIEGAIKPQCQLALRHVARLLKAVDPNVNLRDVVQGICYVTNIKYIDHARKLWEERTNNAIVDYVVVSGLPRDALIEWHVWAHKHNNQFEYEETGKCIEDWSISIFRRWNYENNMAAIVCHVDNIHDQLLGVDILKEAVNYVLQKLQQGHDYDVLSLCTLKIFYAVNKRLCLNDFLDVLEDLRKCTLLVYTLVPVCSLGINHTYISVCGVRHY